MDWNGNLRPFVSRPENSLSFLYNYNYDQYPGAEMKLPMVAQPPHGVAPMMDKNNFANQERKKRLTSDQLESLENSFQEEIRLDPDRKMKLAQELGLQPRQIAVWFQNRRARWKAKQLEQLYDTLKHQFDAVSSEKQKLQEEVLALRAILKDQATKNQVSTGYTEISGEDTVESTSVAIRNSNRARGTSNHQNNMAECNYVLNVDDYNHVMTPAFWGALPSYP